MVFRNMDQIFQKLGTLKKSSGHTETSENRRLGIGNVSNSSARTAAAIAVATSRMTRPSGAILPKPHSTRFGILGVIGSIAIGLVIGSTISQKIANILEEKELFIPSDDDDDDDD